MCRKGIHKGEYNLGKYNGSLSGHFGVSKTLELVQRSYYSLKLVIYVTKYVEKCMVCIKEKRGMSNEGFH